MRRSRPSRRLSIANTAESLEGTSELFVARDSLPTPDENEFYYADLVGLTAMDEADRVIGTVRAIHNYGAGDVIEIARGDGDTVMPPFCARLCRAGRSTLKAGRVVIAEPAEVETGERGPVE